MDSSDNASSCVRENTNPQEEDGRKQQHPKVKSFCSVRYGVAIMIHFCNLIITAQFASLSIAIVAMVNHTDQSNQSNVSTKRHPGAAADIGVPVYDWNPEIQGLLLSAILYGSVITTIPGGYFSGVLGGKKIAGLSLLLCSVLSLLTPLAADSGLPYLFLVRIVQGLSQGMNFSALAAFWPKWAPPLERTQLSTIGLSGTTMGNFIVVIAGGFLCESPGWPSIFYIFGGIGCIFSIIWFSLVYDDPREHPFVSDSEREYIISSLAEQASSPNWSLPFKAMMKTLAIWAIIIPNICRFWLTSNLTTSLPTLLDNMFDLNFEKNGFLSALPLITSWISMTVGSKIADFLLSKKILRLITVRKLFTFLGMFFPSLFTVAIPYVGSTTAITFMILASSASTLCFSGFIVNPLDFAPRYASFIISLGTTAMSISGIVSPFITGYFINQEVKVNPWEKSSVMDSLDNASSYVRENTNPQEEDGRKQQHPKVKSFCSVRYGVAIMIHFCNLIITAQFASLSIAIVAMVNHTDQSNQSNVSTKRHPGAAADIGGMNFSALAAFWPKWAPPLERTQLSTIGLSGTTMGNFIVVIGGGFLCKSPGWPSIFYIFGGIGCIFSIIWFSLVYDDPREHPFVSDSEREYIISSLAEQASSPNWSLPFKAMIKTLAIWAIIIPSICRFWLTSNLTTSLPTLLDNMFDLNFEENGFLSALPLIISWISMTLGSKIADFLLSKKILRLITVRKLFTFLGMFFPSLFTVLIPYVGSTTTVTFIILASSASTLCFSGFIVNPLDFAPRYASFIMSLGTAAMLISGLVSTFVTGYFINQDNTTGWKNVFFLSSAINVLGMIFYLVFGQTDIQDWAKEQRLTRF
ncbi:putative small intestine urate exporter isoform X2 [Phascolarctos cinereus]|uniref:Sodium-dependent phosphate transport protein 3-like isoform X3 n=1 Tax=Phascolarctos cinereus TaxID=38626 RepID=A0A6P5LNK6_PHACI|nr:sodium-dependent phosphate transport protein 3-like isoform X3 [Phascolarctos cinereus]